jgi:predicted ATP-dependent serine protease
MANLPDEVVKKMLAKYDAPEAGDTEVSFDELESFGSEESLKTMFTSIANYNQMLKEKITFINPALSKAIPFTRENLYLICAYTGSGKSTIAANVSHPLWKQQKKSLVISNEESEQDVLFRIGCLELGFNFNDYKKGIMPLSQQKEVAILFKDIAKYVKVVDVNFREGLTTKLEGIINILEKVKDKDYSCVMIDYFQLINKTTKDQNASTYAVLNNLRTYLGRYIKSSNIPVVVFAQLHSIGKRNNKDLDSRIKHCPEILEPSTVVVEVVPNFDDKTSEFIIHKDRFGLSGHKVTCAFDRGRFVYVNPEELIQRRAEQIDDMVGEKNEPTS